MRREGDSELVERARQGDRDAFDALLDRHRPAALRLLSRMISDADLAAEFVQEAAVRSFLSLPRLREASRFQSWFFGIALNVCRSHQRSKLPQVLSLEDLTGGVSYDALLASAAAPQEILEIREMNEQVLHAIEMLPEKDREVVVPFYYQQKSVKEIAAALGLSTAAVKGRLHKARKRLREPLQFLVSDGTPRKKERTELIRSYVAEVYSLNIEHVDTFMVALMEEAGNRVLPIWVGVGEAVAISNGLHGKPFLRPMTYTLMAGLLEASGSSVREVCITSLKEGIFYAVIRLNANGETKEVDSRPSDALALATATGSPIYVNEEVMDTGLKLPDTAPERLTEILREKIALEKSLPELRIFPLELKTGPMKRLPSTDSESS